MGKTNFDQIELDKETPIASPDAPTISATFVQAEVQAIATLANELKAKLNTMYKG